MEKWLEPPLLTDREYYEKYPREIPRSKEMVKINLVCKGYEATCPVCHDSIEADSKSDIEVAMDNHMMKKHSDVDYDMDEEED